MSSEITILLENTKLEQSKFKIEHGLSLYVKTSRSTFIFDCGQTAIFCSNAALMNVDLLKVQFVVLSHSHYDHAAGFPKLLQFVTPSMLYIGNNFWREKFSYDSDNNNYKYRGCGFTAFDLERWNIKQNICNDLIKLDDDAWLIGNINKKYSFETIPKKFVCGKDKRQDDFSDEIVLVLREGHGVAVVTGCAHNGILNIVAIVQQRLNLPVKSVIGGIHLSGVNIERIDKTLNELKKFGVNRLALCHCSGDEVQKRIKNYDFKNYKISTGSIINLE